MRIGLGAQGCVCRSLSLDFWGLKVACEHGGECSGPMAVGVECGSMSGLEGGFVDWNPIMKPYGTVCGLQRANWWEGSRQLYVRQVAVRSLEAETGPGLHA